jgi:hypothetical protein
MLTSSSSSWATITSVIIEYMLVEYLYSSLMVKSSIKGFNHICNIPDCGLDSVSISNSDRRFKL